MEAALTQSGVRCVLRISRHTADSVKTHDLLRIENRLEISRRFAHSGLRSVLKFQDGFQSGVGFHSGLPIPTKLEKPAYSVRGANFLQRQASYCGNHIGMTHKDEKWQKLCSKIYARLRVHTAHPYFGPEMTL